MDLNGLQGCQSFSYLTSVPPQQELSETLKSCAEINPEVQSQSHSPEGNGVYVKLPGSQGCSQSRAPIWHPWPMACTGPKTFPDSDQGQEWNSCTGETGNYLVNFYLWFLAVGVSLRKVRHHSHLLWAKLKHFHKRYDMRQLNINHACV